MKEKLISTTASVPKSAISLKEPVPLILSVMGDMNLQNDGGKSAVFRKETMIPAAEMMLTWMRIWLRVKASAANETSEVPRLKSSDLASCLPPPPEAPA